ncbi:hypothetical protein OTU49_000672 [Cherax quadricarinatus]|uniref:D-beta-hydroxybutyrate dehydrogenase, mitochondrial n=1 Tax=Cherax quadricarinatus TaxID=27406 RepID=A0AAW0XZK2_CHEQU
MLWTWDKTEVVVLWGLVSAMTATVLSVVTDYCCCSLFLSLWAVSSTAYIISASLQVHNSGRAVLVTGCDSGFGLALALHLHKLGFRVFAGCLQIKGTGAEKLRSEGSKRLHVLQMDVTSQKQIDNALKEVKKLLEKGEELWGLVNNAGLATYGEVEWVNIETFRRFLEVNTIGVLAVTKTFLPLIRRAKGRVVTIASGLGRMAVPMRAPYVVSKYAVEGLCDCLRYEMRSWGVKVSIIEPGNFIAGTSIFSETSINDAAKTMWETMSDDVRSDYGREHFEARVNLMKKYAKIGYTDLSPVINAYTEALVQRFPQARYHPMDLYFRLRVFIATHLPEFFYEKIYVGN